MQKAGLRDDKYKLRPQEELYIALECIDLSFTDSEVAQTKEFWKAGIHITDIAAKLKRDVDEIFCLLLDLARKNRIKKRENYVWESDAIG